MSNGDKGEQTKSLAAKLGNLVIVRKGKIDFITDGEKCTKNSIHFFLVCILYRM